MLITVTRRRWFGLLGLGALAAFSRGLTESATIRAARAGDPGALRELMALYSSPLRQYAGRRVPVGDLDDVLQETWVSIWQSLPKVEGALRFKPWAFSVCFHRIQDYWRREQTRRAGSLLELQEQQQAYTPTGFEQVELREVFAGFWSECSEMQREMLSMYYGDGLTLKEIAVILGRNLNTVKYQFYRAHDVAAEHLSDRETNGRGT